MTQHNVEIAVVGAGIAGIAAAYYLSTLYRRRSVLLIDSRQPMSYTSAQSGDNYRNWWPHQTMTSFTNDSIDELDRLRRDTDNVIGMTDGGYVLATRQSDVSETITAIPDDIDVDVYGRVTTIRERFPMLSGDIRNVIHIRRGGDIRGQQLGQYFLEQFRVAGGKRLNGKVVEIDRGSRYQLAVETRGEIRTIGADALVVAAGPFVNHLTTMLGVTLPVRNVYQQKIAFEDTRQAVPRNMPFSVDLDRKTIAWTDAEKALLLEDDDMRWLAEEMPSGTHCRPEGGEHSRWLKLGWAYNVETSDPQEDMTNEAAIDAAFPELVIRGAASFLPALTPYIAELPARMHHYGGYYTMTDENWPLIGPLDNQGAFVIGALSGFGSMAAAAAGKLCAAHVCASALPDYADDLSLRRLSNKDLLAELALTQNKGVL